LTLVTTAAFDCLVETCFFVLVLEYKKTYNIYEVTKKQHFSECYVIYSYIIPKQGGEEEHFLMPHFWPLRHMYFYLSNCVMNHVLGGQCFE
jgi:hypothetical protein